MAEKSDRKSLSILILGAALAILADLLAPPGRQGIAAPGKEPPAAGSEKTASILASPGKFGKLTFAPNQLAANKWYRPLGELINGHIEESFAVESLWPRLESLLIAEHGAFGLNAAEIGHMSSQTLARFRSKGLAISVETPAFTQCLSGRQLGELEFFGRSPPGPDLFRSIFKLSPETDKRFDPKDKGWFYTRDGLSFTPDEIVLDERIPNLLPRFDLDELLQEPSAGWEARKSNALHDDCPGASQFHSGEDRITGLIEDFLEYHAEMTKRFEKPPAFSFHWNVIAGWEWRDEACLDRLAASDPDPAKFEHDYRYLAHACYNDSAVLSQLLDRLCKAGACPRAVYLDMDITYLTEYALEAIRRDRAAIRAHGVGFGVDLTDECNERAHCVMRGAGPDRMILQEDEGKEAGGSESAAAQKSVLNKFAFLRLHDVIDGDAFIRMQSWSTKPKETGAEISESRADSLPDTALKIFTKQQTR
ncbi:hypothetical protein [Methylocystis heyeri]|uniref:Uncharacterized protein n=1 Tax=Methylocystis heyeri TaxID=391905 RepID=A0A6B8KJ69_9HYPH|nr:hypothetical protein [Methylocystis heyeri]QGM46600.1 hypothetical protein H2LOC_013340 [Methylocystis heyeri]